MHHAKPSVIVYGPQGCGKTRHADALRKHFELDKIYDQDCAPVTSFHDLPKSGHLILTHERPPATCRRAMSFDAAMQRLRTQPARNPFG